MMKDMKNYILFIWVCLLVAGCGNDENELTPSRADRDWYVIEDMSCICCTRSMISLYL